MLSLVHRVPGKTAAVEDSIIFPAKVSSKLVGDLPFVLQVHDGAQGSVIKLREQGRPKKIIVSYDESNRWGRKLKERGKMVGNYLALWVHESRRNRHGYTALVFEHLRFRHPKASGIQKINNYISLHQIPTWIQSSNMTSAHVGRKPRSTFWPCLVSYCARRSALCIIIWLCKIHHGSLKQCFVCG